MKKLLLTLSLALCLSSAVVAHEEENVWKYTSTFAIHMDSAVIETTAAGHTVLRFSATETLPDGTCVYTYVYDRSAGTIQIEAMEKTTSTLHYKNNFSPLSVNSPNPVVQDRARMAEDVYQRKVTEKK